MRRPLHLAAIVVPLFLIVQPAFGQIRNIRTFLDQCPTSDPVIAQIRSDFEIRRDGVPTPLPACTEPVSLMPSATYTDELMLLQALRVMYYMDRGMSGHLPWTSGTLYDWAKTKVGGLNIVSSGGGASCCVPFNGRSFILIGAHDNESREFDKKWIYLSVIVSLFGHEARHIDGFPHSSCCGTQNGCDDTYDAANLSPYGVQWWLNKLWLDGTINVGMACQSSLDLADSTDWFRNQVTSTFPSRFCVTRPPTVSPPATPGGACHDVVRRRTVRH